MRAEVILAAGVAAAIVLSTPVIALLLALASLLFSLLALARATEAVRQLEPKVDAQTRAINPDA